MMSCVKLEMLWITVGNPARDVKCLSVNDCCVCSLSLPLSDGRNFAPERPRLRRRHCGGVRSLQIVRGVFSVGFVRIRSAVESHADCVREHFPYSKCLPRFPQGMSWLRACIAILRAISHMAPFVLDTAVIVAATRSDAGASRQLLLAGSDKRFELLLSVPLALEYEAVLKRPEQIAASGGMVQEVDKLLSALIAIARPVYRSFFWRPLLRDADDDMVLETALSERQTCW